MKTRMVRKPHIMNTHKVTQHPSNLMFFDTETKNTYKGKDKNIQHERLWFGCSWAFRYEQGEVTRSKISTWDTSEEFLELLHRRLDSSRPLYLFAHNIKFDLTIVDFWEKADDLGLDCTYAVLEDPPVFLSYIWDDCKLVLIDTFNFWKCSVADMGKQLGIEKFSIDIRTATRAEAEPYCKRDVEIIANQVTNLFDFLTDNDLGSFGISAPSIAMNTYKKRFMKHEIFIHDRVRVMAIERGSYYGGLVENFYIGKGAKQTLYHTDVNSLYPSVMVKEFPCKLIDNYTNMIPKDLRVKGVLADCCAKVRVSSKKNTYCVRHQNRLCQAKGVFDTWLCGPELERCYLSGDLAHIHEISQYEMKPLFKDYVNHLWGLRRANSIPKGNPKEVLIKLLMNSLYGKFGQKGYEWVDFTPRNLESYYLLFGGMCPMRYLTNNYVPNVTENVELWHADGLDNPIQLRRISSKIEMKFPTSEHSESFCAIAAFVTSYARERLRGLIQIAGPKHTYYCDTDSLFVDKSGLENLRRANELDDKELGKLKLEGYSDNWAFYGPKDYQFGAKHTLKGISKKAKDLGNNTFEQLQFEGLASILKRGGENYIEVKTITKHVKRVYSKGLITNSGWTEPFTLNVT